MQLHVGDWIRTVRKPDHDPVAKLLTAYLQLSGRFAGLLKSLWHLYKQPCAARREGQS